MTSSTGSGPCTVCDQPDTRLCGRCRSARYCSKICQRTDWPTHRLLCTSFSNFDPSSRPTENHSRAVYFPVDTNRPEVIWLDSEWQVCHDDDEYEPEGTRFQFPLVEKFLGVARPLKHSSIQYNQVRRKELTDTIYLCHRDAFLLDGSAPNKSVAAVTATQPGQHYNWRGPIVMYAKLGLEADRDLCKDLDMSDFRHITDFFLSYSHTPFPAPTQNSSTKIQGVRINCIGDEKMVMKPLFEAIEVPSTDPIFSGGHHGTSDIAQLIELPIFTRRCPKDPKWANEDENNELFKPRHPFENQDATYLHLCCDPKARPDQSTLTMGWGWAPPQWQSNVGSVIIVRQDRKPLLPLHLELLCNYCRYEICPLLGHAFGELENGPIGPEAVLAMICKPTFIIYWCKLLETRRNNGGDTSTPSPYEI